jgi:hypothetical protein
MRDRKEIGAGEMEGVAVEGKSSRCKILSLTTARG